MLANVGEENKIKEEIKMEMENSNREKIRPSIWDPFIEEVRKYRKLNISLASIHKIVNEELQHKGSYDGFYRWAKRRGIA